MACDLVDVVKLEIIDGYNLHLQFDDGTSGDVDISKIGPFKGVFEKLNDKSFFSRVSINHDIGTICWENGADLSPSYLLANVKATKK